MLTTTTTTARVLTLFLFAKKQSSLCAPGLIYFAIEIEPNKCRLLCIALKDSNLKAKKCVNTTADKNFFPSLKLKFENSFKMSTSGLSTSLIVVSNRLPFVLKRNEDDSLVRKSSAGGLVTAVAPVVVQSGGKHKRTNELQMLRPKP